MHQIIFANGKQQYPAKSPRRRILPLWLFAFSAVSFVELPSIQEIYAADPTNTFFGTNAGMNTMTGTFDTGIGYNALKTNNGGSYNTAVGAGALYSNDGLTNTAIGYHALYSNTTGTGNTASGNSALHNNRTGGANTATGDNALYSNTSGSYNSATGQAALISNTTGFNNTANGYTALSNNRSGADNTATGVGSLSGNATGSYNTATGFHSLTGNSSGRYNTADGTNALYNNSTGDFNTAAGMSALFNNTTGANNIAFGYRAGRNLTTGDGNIDIGNLGLAGESNTIRIGSSQTRAFIAGVRGAVVAGGTAVYVSASGQLGTILSSQRFKENIASMDKSSEAILALRPVTFRYKDELDPAKTPQFGLIAEEVAKVNPDLVVRDEKDHIYSVRYDAVNAMLLSEFLKEHRRVENLEQSVAELKAALKEQSAQLQRVSTHVTKQKSISHPVTWNR